MIKILKTILITFLLIPAFTFGQTKIISDQLYWEGVIEEEIAEGTYIEYLWFQNAILDQSFTLPKYHANLPHSKAQQAESRFIQSTYQTCSSEENQFLIQNGFSQTEVSISTSIFVERKKSHVGISFIPIRRIPGTNNFEKLVDFQMEITFSEEPAFNSPSIASRSYAENSVLATGDWYKLRLSESGIYKLGYDDLSNMGLNVDAIDPAFIKIYGNGGGMLPEKNSDPRPDDLKENPILIEGGDDGSFDPGDYILFFGESPNSWEQVLDYFNYHINLYDDHNYYFLTVSDEPGLRIETIPSVSANATYYLSSYNQNQAFEEDNINLILSGKHWYADEYGEMLEKTYLFNFPDRLLNEQVKVKMGVANRTYINDHLVVHLNGNVADTITLTSVNPASTKYAQKKKTTLHFTPDGEEIAVKLEYLQAEQASKLWLDYITVQTRSALDMQSNHQLLFRDITTLNEGAITRFTIANSPVSTSVWDVTNPTNPFAIEGEFSGNDFNFKVHTDSLRDFIAFDGNEYLTPEFIQMVENQNIHGSGQKDYIILTHPDFREQADRLKTLHQSYGELSILVVENQMVYNEFSGGKQDPTAIRDMMKMFYDRYPGEEARFLLLFGDGSFDPKDRIEHNTNFIPTFQTEESWISASSYVVDDYFGLLDDNEGNDAIGVLDIGIGRFPVTTIEEATTMVDKVERYLNTDGEQLGPWKNRICFIADDEDSNLHFIQADSLAEGMNYIPHQYNVNKIYLDAYPQQTTPSGDRYPEVGQKINEQIEEGALIINYIGHGGAGGWAHERILLQGDILNWSNKERLPTFVTATCEFSRFDEPELVSGGELVLLNPNGGGIALFTTTRLAYAQSNFRLNERFYSIAFTETENGLPYMGDLIRRSKPPNQLTTRNFVLLGDPALRIAYPKNNVRTVSINDNPVDPEVADTISSLQLVTIKGLIEDSDGNLLPGFIGTIYPIVYDKPSVYSTIGNDVGSFPVEFEIQDKIIWQGNSPVENGEFEFSFFIPKDINYSYGHGKISYYAENGTTDASDYSSDFILGGSNATAANDNLGPEIDLYINDSSFVSGDISHNNPLLIAKLFDEHGINTSNNGIGHDLIAFLNDDYSNQLILNDFFKYESSSYQQGTINYPFYLLPDGRHTLTVKAWDSYNNSSEKSIVFLIDSGSPIDLSEVMNYPNPFSEETNFAFKHTKPGEELDILLEIFDLRGQFILSYKTTRFSESSYTDLLTWDGKDPNGNDLMKGIYLYKLTVSDQSGHVTQQLQKLIKR